jgi:hypothetical protein
VASINKDGFSEELLTMVKETFSNKESIRKEYQRSVAALGERLSSFHEEISELVTE